MWGGSIRSVAETNLKNKCISEKDVTCDLLESLKRGEELKATISKKSF